MTAKEVIEYTDKIKPNSFDIDTKLAWINHVEGMVQAEIMKTPIWRINVISSEDEVLAVKHPYSQIYSLYIVSMIDFFSGDFVKYQNSSAAYNEAMKLYAKYALRGEK